MVSAREAVTFIFLWSPGRYCRSTLFCVGVSGPPSSNESYRHQLFHLYLNSGACPLVSALSKHLNNGDGYNLSGLRLYQFTPFAWSAVGLDDDLLTPSGVLNACVLSRTTPALMHLRIDNPIEDRGTRIGNRIAFGSITFEQTFLPPC